MANENYELKMELEELRNENEHLKRGLEEVIAHNEEFEFKIRECYWLVLYYLRPVS